MAVRQIVSFDEALAPGRKEVVEDSGQNTATRVTRDTQECVFAHEKIHACKTMCQYVNTTKSFRCRPGLQPPQIPT